MPQETKLTPQEEKKFQEWYAKWAQKLNLDPDPDNPLHYYDYRGAFKAGAAPTEESGWHWPSEFKREGHPNLIVDGRDTRTGESVSFPPRPGIWDQIQRATKDIKAQRTEDYIQSLKQAKSGSLGDEYRALDRGAPNPYMMRRPPEPNYAAWNELLLNADPESMSDQQLSEVRTELSKLITKRSVELEYLKGSEQDLSGNEQILQEVVDRFKQIDAEQAWRSRPQTPPDQRGPTKPPEAQARLSDQVSHEGLNYGNLGDVVRSAWESAIQRTGNERPGSYAAGEGLGPDLVAALNNFYNLTGLGDPSNIGPAASMHFVPGRVLAREVESAAGRGLARGKGVLTKGDIQGYLFDPEAPGRGLHSVRAQLAPRAQAEGNELILRALYPEKFSTRTTGDFVRRQSERKLFDWVASHPESKPLLADAIQGGKVTARDVHDALASATKRASKGSVSLKATEAADAREIANAINEWAASVVGTPLADMVRPMSETGGLTGATKGISLK